MKVNKVINAKGHVILLLFSVSDTPMQKNIIISHLLSHMNPELCRLL